MGAVTVRNLGRDKRVTDPPPTTHIENPPMPTRSDKLAARLFLLGLDGTTYEALKRQLLRLAKAGKTKPKYNTRVGLALISATEEEFPPCEPREILAQYDRVAPLWTVEEHARFYTAASCTRNPLS